MDIFLSILIILEVKTTKRLQTYHILILLRSKEYEKQVDSFMCNVKL